MRSLRLWRLLVGARIRSQWQHRTSFVVDAIAAFFIMFVDFIAILVLFTHFRELRGWSVGEVAFLFGAAGLGFSLADIVIGHIEETNVQIRTGQFDVFLLRPAGTLTQIVASDFALRRIGKVAQALVVLAYAFSRTDIHWTVAKGAMMVLMTVCGAAIFAGMWILGAALTFWTVDSGEVGNGFTYGGNFMSQYPLDIYGPWLRRLLGFVIPTAFVVYFPALYVLDKRDPFGFPHWFQFASPAVAVVVLAVAAFVWRIAVRHYRSTGS